MSKTDSQNVLRPDASHEKEVNCGVRILLLDEDCTAARAFLIALGTLTVVLTITTGKRTVTLCTKPVSKEN